PFLLLVVLIAIGLIFGRENERSWLDGILPDGRRWAGGFLIVLIASATIYSSVHVRTTARVVLDAIAGKAWDADSELHLYRQLQAAIPPGQRFLAFLPMAHLLDFARNPINVMDSNCGISPPPGMPLKRAPEEVAQYLRSLGISWVASRARSWTPAGETRDLEEIRRWSESFRGKNQWDVSVVYSHYLMAMCVRELAATYETSRFANDLLAINLGRPRAVKTAAREPP